MFSNFEKSFEDFTSSSSTLEDCIFFNKESKQICHRIGNSTFQVDERYSDLLPLGKGTFGSVCSAYDSILQRHVAIKKVANTFRSKRSAERLFREILVLRQFHHPNLLELINLERPNTMSNYNDVYLITELMSCDLHRLIHSNVCFNDMQTTNILYQILLSVGFLHHHDILHRDIKPSNVFIDLENGLLKLGDFGLSTKQYSGMEKNVVTRWYRAPELLYHDFSLEYDHKIDLWSIGCILGEILLRRPLFCGNDNSHMLRLIVGFKGTPDGEDFRNMNEETRLMFKRIGYVKKRSMRDIFGNINPKMLDLLSRLLEYDPKKRISAKEALKHPFFRDRIERDDLNFMNDQQVQKMNVGEDRDVKMATLVKCEVDNFFAGMSVGSTGTPQSGTSEKEFSKIENYRNLVSQQIREIQLIEGLNTTSILGMGRDGQDDEVVEEEEGSLEGERKMKTEMDELFLEQMKMFIESTGPLASKKEVGADDQMLIDRMRIIVTPPTSGDSDDDDDLLELDD